MRKIILISISIFICAFVHAQADLSISGPVTVSPSGEIHVGITISVTFSVQNASSITAAGASHTGIYLSPTTSIGNGTLISEISLEPLPPGVSSNNIQFNFPIPYTVGVDGVFYVIVKLNDENEISETDYNNNIANTSITANHEAWAAQNIPYPIIFVHGYMSDNTTWNDMIGFLKNTYGWSYGGNMDFCLNADQPLNAAQSLTTSDITSDYRDFSDVDGHRLNPNPSDFYTINFAVNPDGSTHYKNKWESNQAAIVKQGLAIRDAIEHVLNVTKKDKVILVCHSMGGLAAREYLQNTKLFQASDGKKHVAKLITIGTPHGGTDIPALYLGGIFHGNDEQSEAIRDLRTDYATFGYPGVYLFGGEENQGRMLDYGGLGFKNVNVNCNSTPSGETIIGINSDDKSKAIPTDLTYSCVIGTGDLLPIDGDGVVTEYSANINNFKPSVNATIFTLPENRGVWDPLDPWHIEETKQVAAIMQGMDEPSNDFVSGHAYSISSGQLYYGNLTAQSGSGNNSVRDYDGYTINASSSGNLNIQVYNIPALFFSINVFNSGKAPIYSIDSHGKSYLNVDVPVTAGNNYITLSGVPDADSYKYPYAFKCTYSASTSYCSGTTNLTAASGSFTDGSGSNDYSNNADCRWKIQPRGATSISLNFSMFKVSKPGDTVYVYDGSTTASPLLGKFTGSSLPASVTSTGGTMLVRFSTDAANTAGGWKADYTSVTVPVYCNGTTLLTDASAIFSDGSSTNNYGNNSHCSWLITPAGAYSVTLNFLTFKTEAINDVVNVYDGNDNNAPLIGSFSGNSLPSSLTSSGGAMFIEFITNNTITKTGWSATYTSYIPYNNTGIVKYESWFDDNYTKKVSVSITPQDTFRLNSNIPTTNLSAGLHFFHVRFKDDKNKWSSVVNQFFVKLPQTSDSNSITAYEYWFDDNYAGKTTQTISGQQTYQLLTGIHVTGLTKGLHSFHIRFKDVGNVWSAVVSQFIVKNPAGGINQIKSYEYWFDNNYAGKIVQTTNSQEIYQLLSNINTGTLTQGLHSFHIRFKDAGGAWSSTVNQFIIYAPSGVSKIDKYEYWFDNKYGQKVRVNVSPSVQIYTFNTAVSASSLNKGSHTLHIRFRQTNNLWSAVLSQKFTKTTTLNIAAIDVNANKLSFTDNSPLFVYPNPTKGKFYIGIDDDANIKSIKISDGNGKIIYAKSSLAKTTILEIDLSNYASGVYYIEATDDEKEYDKKIVVAK